MRSKTLAVTAFSATLALAAPAAQSAVVYSQPRQFPTGALIVSEFATSSGIVVQQAYDNFTLGASASINQVGFSGGYFNPTGSSQALNSFTVTFYANNGGVPGASLYSASILGNAGQTAAGTDSGGNLNFSYQLDLPTAFAAAGGTQYWLSVLANVNTNTPFWGWRSATGGDNSFLAQQPSVSTNFNEASSDLAFTLSENPIPEPASLVILGGSLLGFAAARRARR